MSELSVTRLHYVASDGYTNHMSDMIDTMDDSDFGLFLQYHYATCEREDMVGMTHHALDIFRKE